MNKKICISIILTISCKSAISGWFGPSNYEECIFEKMKGVNSDIAARAVMQACFDKFPPPPPPPPTAEELEKKRAEQEELAKQWAAAKQQISEQNRQKEMKKQECIERVKKQRQADCENNIYFCAGYKGLGETYPECGVSSFDLN